MFKSIAIRPAPTPDPIEVAVADLVTCDDPKQFLDRVAALATRAKYCPAACALEVIVIPGKRTGATERRLVQTLADSTLLEEFRVFRIAFDLNVFEQSEGQTCQRFVFDDLIAATTNRRKARNAWVALAVLRHVRAASSVIALEDTADNPGFFPTVERERAALALNLLVRKFIHGERFDAIRLVAP